jgi:hypothetical protein
MRKTTALGRKSERIRKNQRAEGSLGQDLSDQETTDLEDIPVLVEGPGELNTRSPYTSQSPEAELGPDREGDPILEEEDNMTRLRYRRFKGDGEQDADEWMCEFESTAVAN